MAKAKIAIVDYGMGNLRSVEKAFLKEGGEVVVTQAPSVVKKADKVVVPGVGAFSQAMKQLKKLGLDEAVYSAIDAGVPYLGLCLGLQLLFEKSEEGDEKGLGILPGKVVRFRQAPKVPHMGWNNLRICIPDNPLFSGIGSGDYFYFVHSFYAVPGEKSCVLSKTQYGKSFCSSVWLDNVFATQFHPEKSQASGLKVIRNFVRL